MSCIREKAPLAAAPSQKDHNITYSKNAGLDLNDFARLIAVFTFEYALYETLIKGTQI